jgi:hypothetical protein
LAPPWRISAWLIRAAAAIHLHIRTFPQRSPTPITFQPTHVFNVLWMSMKCHGWTPGAEAAFSRLAIGSEWAHLIPS